MNTFTLIASLPPTFVSRAIAEAGGCRVFTGPELCEHFAAGLDADNAPVNGVRFSKTLDRADPAEYDRQLAAFLPDYWALDKCPVAAGHGRYEGKDGCWIALADHAYLVARRITEGEAGTPTPTGE